MIKINQPPKTYQGHIYLDYIGSNLAFINPEDGGWLKDVVLYSSKVVSDGEKLRNCFLVDISEEHFLVSFDNMQVYKCGSNEQAFKRNEYSFLNCFETYINRGLFIIVGRFSIYNEINDNDERYGRFKFVIELEKIEKITNLFI